MGGESLSFGGSVPSAVLPPWIRQRKLSLGELHEIKRQMRRQSAEERSKWSQKEFRMLS